VALLDRAIVRVLPAVPRPVVKRLSQRYIAGSSLDDAVHVATVLNGTGKMATIDVLGEEITRPEEAAALLTEYEDVFETIEREGLDSNVSVKLTGLGLNLDHDLCRENVAELVREAAARANFVRIDMEDSSTTTETLEIYRELRGQGLDNVGVVLQAYMKRTFADVAALADLTPNVRVCKGIYVEPPDIAFQEFEERGLTPAEYEFQMLLGVRPELGDELVREGHRLRIYVPYGRQWYEYSLRRLQENPKIAGYIAVDTLKRLKH
jgi:proline dehydrogenase